MNVNVNARRRLSNYHDVVYVFNSNASELRMNVNAVIVVPIVRFAVLLIHSAIGFIYMPF
jgi:hypothetical protein